MPCMKTYFMVADSLFIRLLVLRFPVEPNAEPGMFQVVVVYSIKKVSEPGNQLSKPNVRQENSQTEMGR